MSPASESEETDLSFLELCQRASHRLGVPWPAAQDPLEGRRSVFKGKTLTSAAPPSRQLLPLHPDVVSGLKMHWAQPQSGRVPVKGFCRLDTEGLQAEGLAELPAVEPEVAHHLPWVTPPPGHRSGFWQESPHL